jgi:hypothetical protein
MNMIACTSNRSSIHLFEIKKSVEKCIETKHVGFSNGDVAKNPDGDNKKSKYIILLLNYYRLQFMKFITKYFNSEWSVSKIKIDEKLKTVGFDVKNHRMIIVTYDRILYYVDIPENPTRYLENAEIRTFQSDYS